MRYKRDGFCMKCSVANHKRDERIVEKRVKKNQENNENNIKTIKICVLDNGHERLNGTVSHRKTH